MTFLRIPRASHSDQVAKYFIDAGMACNNMNPSDPIERLESAMMDFLVPLRMGEGFNFEKFEIACTVIKEFSLEWKQQQVIPKAAAILFLDAHSAMMSCSDLYPPQTSFIQEKADMLHTLIRDCCER